MELRDRVVGSGPAQQAMLSESYALWEPANPPNQTFELNSFKKKTANKFRFSFFFLVFSLFSFLRYAKKCLFFSTILGVVVAHGPMVSPLDPPTLLMH